MVRVPPDPIDVLIHELVARHDVGPKTGLLILRRAAARKQVSLAHLAGTIVEAALHPAPAGRG